MINWNVIYLVLYLLVSGTINGQNNESIFNYAEGVYSYSTDLIKITKNDYRDINGSLETKFRKSLPLEDLNFNGLSHPIYSFDKPVLKNSKYSTSGLVSQNMV